jgi:hypothetical protein
MSESVVDADVISAGEFDVVGKNLADMNAGGYAIVFKNLADVKDFGFEVNGLSGSSRGEKNGENKSS